MLRKFVFKQTRICVATVSYQSLVIINQCFWSFISSIHFRLSSYYLHVINDTCVLLYSNYIKIIYYSSGSYHENKLEIPFHVLSYT